MRRRRRAGRGADIGADVVVVGSETSGRMSRGGGEVGKGIGEIGGPPSEAYSASNS